MVRFERGEKRLCASCGARFYDLGHAPIRCPKCEAVFEIPPPPPPRVLRPPRQMGVRKPDLPVAVEPETEVDSAEEEKVEDDILILDDAEDDPAEEVIVIPKDGDEK